jgi:hypothetical protein
MERPRKFCLLQAKDSSLEEIARTSTKEKVLKGNRDKL